MASRDFSDGLTPERARQALRDYAGEDRIDPRSNSVFMLGQALFRALHLDEIDMESLIELVYNLHEKLALRRAERLRDGHGMSKRTDPFSPLAAEIEARADAGADALQQTIDSLGRIGLVFTAHPTFSISRELRAALARCATKPGAETHKGLAAAVRDEAARRGRISLQAEHGETQVALGHAREALGRLARIVLRIARTRFPDEWQSLRLRLPTLASWVGYDLDGRTDIQWYQTVSLRLSEKAEQLRYYARRSREIGGEHPGLSVVGDMAAEFEHAAEACAEHSASFAGIGEDPAAVVRAANALTASGRGRLVDIEPWLARIDALKEEGVSDDRAEELAVLRAEMATFGLGTAHIHLRVNAAQIGNIVRRDLGLETEGDQPGRLAMRTLASKTASADRREVSFADMFLENSTAHRQFMLCAQILKHIDARTPIRFLIAEAENPATVMAALYLARLYRVDDRVDISPLFETPDALESGGRFVGTLLREELYREYVRGRGRLCVQLGFSDSGRFIGQIAANMAIERIHNLILGALREHDLDVEVVFFNTHGESMGRGGGSCTLNDRFDLLLTAWVRRQARQGGLKIRHEVSFQGGDGFLHFASPELAQSAIAALCRNQIAPAVRDPDEFYSDGVLVWDLYRNLRNWHEQLFADTDYARLLDHFAVGLQMPAGSRPVRRRAGGGPANLRAISHNAILQQLGMPLNIACGLGSAMPRETDELVALINGSRRMRMLLAYAYRARGLSSIPALRAYASVYDPALWVAMINSPGPGGAREAEVRARIAGTFADGAICLSVTRIANALALDLHQFDILLERLDDAPSARQRHEDRLDLHVLHAVRVAVMMRVFTIAGSLRAFSPRHDIGLDEIVHLIAGLDVGEAVDRLNRIFPKSAEGSKKLNAVEEVGHRSMSSLGYARFHEDIVVPLAEIEGLLHILKVAISHTYSAHG